MWEVGKGRDVGDREGKGLDREGGDREEEMEVGRKRKGRGSNGDVEGRGRDKGKRWEKEGVWREVEVGKGR